MKTVFYVIGLVVFSALMLSPKTPEKYPPKEVLERRREIVFKEKTIHKLIDTIEKSLNNNLTNEQ